MTHFLARLVERARGTAAQVEPIITPRFASAPVMEITSEPEASPLSRRDPPERKASDATAEPVARAGEPSTTTTANGSAEKAAEAAPQEFLVPLERTDDAVALRPNWTHGSESLRRDSLPLVQSAGAPLLVRRPNHQRPSAIPRSPQRPSLAATFLNLPNEASVERPIVRVTIGRIEVRAAPAPPAPARKPAPRSEPKLTLDAYLRARKEGAR